MENCTNSFIVVTTDTLVGNLMPKETLKVHETRSGRFYGMEDRGRSSR